MDLEHKAIERIQTASEMSLHYYGLPLVCTYSGGKDSDVILELFRRSGVPFEIHNSHTTADAPQTVYHIRDVYKKLENDGIKCTIDYHVQPDGKRITMWNLIPQKRIPPRRNARYCCSVLKETGCANRMIATGIRNDESTNRGGRRAYEAIAAKKENAISVSDEKMLLTDNDESRKLFERCELKAKTVVNPIIDWTHRDIWDFINSEHLAVNELYYCGYERVGCIGCPMAGKRRWREFGDFPKYKDAYIRAFDRCLKEREKRGLKQTFKSGYDLFLWWMEDENVEGQMSIFDYGVE